MSDLLLQRWLRSLGYPYSSAVRPSRPSSLHRAINYLEDVHIRLLPPSSRAPLRLAATFPAALDAYVLELGGVSGLTLHAATRWLARRALQEALQEAAKEGANEVVDPWEGRCVPAVRGAAEGLGGAVEIACGVLGVRGEGVEVLTALGRVAEALGREEGEKVGLGEVGVGFGVGGGVERVVKVLRLLYVGELRAVQDRVNEAIAAMQRVTAEPKTDSRLGCVGR